MPAPPVTSPGSSNQEWGWIRNDGPSIVYGIRNGAWPERTTAHTCDWMKPHSNRAVWQCVYFYRPTGSGDGVPIYVENNQYGELEVQYA